MDGFTACEEAYRNGYEAGLRDSGRWISVKDRLPEKEGTYLVATKNGGVLMDHFYARHKNWGGARIDPLITHWLPRPKPPKEVN